MKAKDFVFEVLVLFFILISTTVLRFSLSNLNDPIPHALEVVNIATSMFGIYLLLLCLNQEG